MGKWTLDLEKLLPVELLERLKMEADQTGTAWTELVVYALERYLDETDDDESEEAEALDTDQILADFRGAWDVRAGGQMPPSVPNSDSPKGKKR